MIKPSKGTIPLRRQLAKKVVHYFDELKEKTKSDSVEKAIRKLNGSQSPNKKDIVAAGVSPNSYQDDVYNRLKLSKVNELMKEEVLKSNVDGALEYQDPGFSKSLLLKSVRSGGIENWSRNSSLEPKQPVKEVLKSKIEEADKIEQNAVKEYEDEEFANRDGLFHIDLAHIEAYKDSKDKDKFDRHQRKSKEIRRIQYWADFDSRNKNGKGSRSPERIKDQVDDAEDFEEDPRSDPRRKYPIWAVVNGASLPGFISSVHGFALNEDRKNIEIREGDIVVVEPKKLNDFRIINGKVQKPSRKDGDCDFTAVEKNSNRFPIQITERKKKREVPNSNCTLYDDKGNRLGRAKIGLSEIESGRTGSNASFRKGILLDSDSGLSLILAKLPKSGHVWYKDDKGVLHKDRVANNEIAVIGQHQMECLTLHPMGKEDPDFPRQIYLFGPRSQIENHPIYEGEDSIASCEDGKDYEGELRVQQSEHNNLLWIRREPEDGNRDRGYDYINVDLDNKCSYAEIEDLLEQMKALANKRKHQKYRNSEKKKEGLDFRIIDKKGRKLRVKITDDNDSDFEPNDSELDPEEEPQAIYYRLEYDGEKLLPLNVMKKANYSPNSQHKSARDGEFGSPLRTYPNNREFDPNSDVKPKNSATGRTKFDREAPESETVGKGQRLQISALSPNPTKRSQLNSARGTYSGQSQKSNRDNNMRIQLDIADADTKNIKVRGEGEARINQKVLPLSGLHELGLKQEKLSEQVKRITNKAVSDIQIFLRYCINKEKFRSNNVDFLAEVRKGLGNPRLFRKFIAYFMDLPSSVSMKDAYKSYSDVIGRKA